MHALPGGNGQGGAVDEPAQMGPAVARRALACDGRCVDLRARPGGTEPDRLGGEVLPARARSMNAPLPLEVSGVAFRLDGRDVVAAPGETILQAADRLGLGGDIPRLCYTPRMRADGNCRACMVEIKGERVLAPSCCRAPAPGMDVQSASERARHSQKMVLELLASDMPQRSYKPDSELDQWCEALGVTAPRFPGRAQPAPDLSHPAMAVNLDACIQCTRGVGCQLTYHVQDNTIVRVEGRDGIANESRLCVKGRFGFDYAAHPHRLTKPLIRKPGVAKSAEFTVDPANPLSVFREASWEEALALAGGTLKRIRDTKGPKALAGFGSAKGSNEDAYLFQKLVRTGFGSNNVDHCTRLCHASSVAALLEGIGSGAVSNPVMDVLKAEVV